MGKLKAKIVRAWCWLVGHNVITWTDENVRKGYDYTEHSCLRCGESWGGPW